MGGRNSGTFSFTGVHQFTSLSTSSRPARPIASRAQDGARRSRPGCPRLDRDCGWGHGERKETNSNWSRATTGCSDRHIGHAAERRDDASAARFMPDVELPRFIAERRQQEGIAARALEFATAATPFRPTRRSARPCGGWSAATSPSMTSVRCSAIAERSGVAPAATPGHVVNARAHLEQALVGYDPKRDRSLAFRFGRTPPAAKRATPGSRISVRKRSMLAKSVTYAECHKPTLASFIRLPRQPAVGIVRGL